MEDLLSELNSSLANANLTGDEESFQKIRELLQCPVCLEIPLPPIYLCKRGHIVCNPCQDRTFYCPLCRDEYSNTRSFVAEGLVESFTMKCRFRDQGCMEVLKGSAMVNHMKVCEFRPAKCIYCHGDYIPFIGYFDHLLSVHKIDGVQKAEGTIKYNIPLAQVLETSIGKGKYCWAPSYFQCYERTFMFHVHVANGSVCGWLALLGVEADCKKYECEIEFKGNKFKVTWKGQVNNFREDPIISICKSGRGLILPFEIVRSNSIVNNCTHVVEWSYNVYIREVAEPQDPGEGSIGSGVGQILEGSTTPEDVPEKEDTSVLPVSVELDGPLTFTEPEAVDDAVADFERYLATAPVLTTPGLEELRRGLYNELDIASEF